MFPPLSSLKYVWVEVTDFDSIRLQLIITGAAALLGFRITWELSEVWEQMFGYSSVMTILITLIVFYTLYFCLSYVVSRTSLKN